MLATKDWAKGEARLVREAEHHLNVELFLDEYPQWDLSRPHHPLILQQMFAHAAASEQREAERHVYHRWWEGPSKLDPEAGVPTIQLVGFWTTREEVADLYKQVYMLWRLLEVPHAELLPPES